MTNPLPDERRKEILADYLDRFERGEKLEVLNSEIITAHPQLKDDFRRLAASRANLTISGAQEQPPPKLPDFEYLGVLGRGGMGIVYKARQISLDRIVALDLRDGRVYKDSPSRFLREQQTLAKLHQSSIVPIHTAGRVGAWQYFAMKFIDGASLRHLVGAAFAHSSAGKPTPSLEILANEYDPASVDNRPLSSSGTHGDQHRKPATFLFTPDYFQSVARGLADVADALHYAHGDNILHRDVKPSNIMVDKSGVCWLVDFGLSRERILVEPKQATSPLTVNEPVGDDDSVAPAGSDQTAGAVGTVCYMSPEQYRGTCDQRSDIYGFGVTLYEALSLRPAFEEKTWRAAMDSKKLPEPIPLEQLVPAVPKDLAAICRKAMQADATRRYATAAEVSADLRHWLAGEPTQARPAGLLRRYWLWSRRNKSLSAALVCASLALLLFSFVAWRWGRSEKARALAAEELAESHEFDLRIEDIERRRRRGLEAGWRGETLALISAAAAKARTDPRIASIRDLAAAALSGIDVLKLKNVERDSSSVAFDATGERLLCGGWTKLSGQPTRSAAIWELTSPRENESVGRLGSGPVAFQPDGTPVQLTWETSQTIVLWNVEQDREIHRWSIAEEVDHAALVISQIAPTALSADGLLSAVAVAGSDTQGKVMVWNNASGDLRFAIPCPATALAFSRDSSMLAAGDAAGNVLLWSLRDGTHVLAIKNSHSSVYCLDFSAGALLVEAGGAARPQGRLVIGDAGSLATVRDLGTGDVVCHLRGSGNWVLAAAYSANDLLIATSAVGGVNLWNSRTGQLLAQLDAGQQVTGLAFSPDGSRLATCGETTFAPGRITLWELENGRGTTDFYGLAVQVVQTILSPDNVQLAALSHEGEIALWNRASGNLLFRWSVPQADYVDNTQIGFSSDGSKLYYAGQQEFFAWDTSSGEIVFGPIELNPGLSNKLAFLESGEILVLRCETLSGILMPDSRSNRATDPRVFRVYHLNGPDPGRPIRELAFSDRGVADSRTVLVDDDFSPDGELIVIEVYLVPIGAQREEGERFIKAFDSLSGREVFSISSDFNAPSRSYAFPKSLRSATGWMLRIQMRENEPAGILVNLPSGEIVPSSIALQKPDGTQVFNFVMNSTETLAFDVAPATMHCLIAGRIFASFNGIRNIHWRGFSQSSDYWIDSTTSGTVRVHDYSRIRRELSQLGLGW